MLKQTLKYNYITSRLQGRTGNLMFQIANGFSKALRYNRQFIVSSAGINLSELEKTIFRKLNFLNIETPSSDFSKHITSPFHYTTLDNPADNIPTVYNGWYQSSKFFEENSSEIIKLYSPTKKFILKALLDFPFLNDSIIAAINIRRGDYLTQPNRHPVVTTSYINEAYTNLPAHDKLIIMSDDIEWCKQNLNFPNSIFIDPQKYWDHEGIWLLSLCHHFIISNSSYSWWCAWLSKNKNKKVISPSVWVGPDITDNVQDIWCDDWIKIPTKYENGKIVLNL